MKLFEFFAESDGRLSNVRLLSTLTVCTALFVVIAQTWRAQPVDIASVTVLLGMGYTGKLVQKGIENKANSEMKI